VVVSCGGGLRFDSGSSSGFSSNRRRRLSRAPPPRHSPALRDATADVLVFLGQANGLPLPLSLAPRRSRRRIGLALFTLFCSKDHRLMTAGIWSM
jgi:hypothetical protein